MAELLSKMILAKYAFFTWIINTWHQTLNFANLKSKWWFVFTFLLLFILRSHFMLIQILDPITTLLKKNPKEQPTSNFGIIWDLLRSYQDSIVSFCILFTQLLLVCTPYRISAHLSEEINIQRVCYRLQALFGIYPFSHQLHVSVAVSNPDYHIVLRAMSS